MTRMKETWQCNVKNARHLLCTSSRLATRLLLGRGEQLGIAITLGRQEFVAIPLVCCKLGYGSVLLTAFTEDVYPSDECVCVCTDVCMSALLSRAALVLPSKLHRPSSFSFSSSYLSFSSHSLHLALSSLPPSPFTALNESTKHSLGIQSLILVIMIIIMYIYVGLGITFRAQSPASVACVLTIFIHPNFRRRIA